MKLPRLLYAVLLVQIFICPPLFAGDFSWLKELNISATADSSGFRTTLATRFHIGNAEINAVFSNVDGPADAYMVLRLGELSHRSPDYVLEQYHAYKHKGWGVLAKRLGIKPGSREFHALKAGHDLHLDGTRADGEGGGMKHKGHYGHGNGGNKNKSKGKHR
ncbi:MAG: hypothetical protein PVJ39_21380 [Gammaproteobacteria bacterium]|jgi:hypothetical protein